MSQMPFEDRKRSSADTYTAIHNALAEAKIKLDNVHAAVEGIQGQLAAGYGGEDGDAFRGVVQRWLLEFEDIRSARTEIAGQVEQSSHTDRQALHANLDLVNQQGRQSAFHGSGYAQSAHEILNG